MSSQNSVAQSSNEAEREAPRAAFSVPEELARRYDIRTVQGNTEGERRIGLFSPGSPNTPALEIANEKILAHRHDRETVESLVRLARHNGWEAIAIEGSPEFRRAVWEAASRAGLEVGGYEPTFAEREHLETLRREDTERARNEGRNGEAEPVAGSLEAAAEPAYGATASSPRAEAHQAQEDRERHVERENEELAELFLHGVAAAREAEPRLANALEAQEVMERHIVHAFDGDAAQIEAANLESRQMISDVLRRGLDVSARAPSPVRQIEPIQAPQMER